MMPIYVLLWIIPFPCYNHQSIITHNHSDLLNQSKICLVKIIAVIFETGKHNWFKSNLGLKIKVFIWRKKWNPRRYFFKLPVPKRSYQIVLISNPIKINFKFISLRYVTCFAPTFTVTIRRKIHQDKMMSNI